MYNYILFLNMLNITYLFRKINGLVRQTSLTAVGEAFLLLNPYSARIDCKSDVCRPQILTFKSRSPRCASENTSNGRKPIT